MAITIALAGNPNCGKTTMFNALTGSSQYVGNWPGVTVEKKAGKLKGRKDVHIIDLPGIYSLSPYTREEVVSRKYLTGECPDVVLNLVDASNIERNLYLTTQLLELGVPVVVALNMIDIVRKNGDAIQVQKLSEALGCPVIETSALKGAGLDKAVQTALKAAAGQKQQPFQSFSSQTEQFLSQIQEVLSGVKGIDAEQIRWFAVKAFEQDWQALEQVSLTPAQRAKIESVTQQAETEMDDDSESIITNERYDRIGEIVSKCIRKFRSQQLSASDRIDRIVTNRWLALPIFAVVMWIVYAVSISTVGTWATDWVNDSLFGEMIPNAVGGFLERVNCAPWLSSLILDGIIAGVGAVLGFLPQMLVLFFFLALLEDCGYMARIAFIMDRIFRRFGLSGKSFIPMLIGTGCGVPGIMASRTIENEHDRKMTIMLTTFIPCGAKLPIIALIAGALFPESSWVAPSAYFIGVGAILLSGIILKKTRLFAGEPAPFVMELPAYHIPGVKGVLIHMWERGKSFIQKAGTVIFLACGLIWFLSNFNFQLEMVEAERSILASFGNLLAPLFQPLGFGDWRAAVATITGLVAKENVVGTFGILYGGLQEVAENGEEIWSILAASYTQVAAYSFLVFNLLCAPCFAAIGAIRREMGNFKWTMIAVGYQCIFAYVASFVIYQLGSVLFGTASFGVGAVIAILIVAVIVWLAVRKYHPDKRQPARRAIDMA